MGTDSAYRQIRVGILTAPHIRMERTPAGTLLHDVRIGIGFHWDRHEDQLFEGDMQLVDNGDGTQTAVNTLLLEDYLTSVISSEMSADSPLELLKAHAVIARSWALRSIARGGNHAGYHVCADDHCQRYEGLLRRSQRAVEAVRATEGEVLLFGDEVCDCRYHKCCGGRTEQFETCWEDVHIPYLTSVDCPYCDPRRNNEHLVKEQIVNALNDYDRETTDFHDWTVRYAPAELADILRQKTGHDFGDILALRPLARGTGGRIFLLEVQGTRRTEVFGKELRIRQVLSPSCLYSSWFDVERDTATGEFILHGHGWGHGVGLCQIGAAVMAHEGHSYRDILAHYYPHSRCGISNKA